MRRHLDRCEQCHLGQFKVYKTRTRGSSRVRFLKCNHCGLNDKEVFQVDHLGRPVLAVSTWRGTELSQNATESR